MPPPGQSSAASENVPPSPVRPRRPSAPPDSQVSLAAQALPLAGAAAGVFLVGGAEQGAAGVFLLCAGTALVCCPPRVKVEWRLWLAGAGVLLGAALALLPHAWFPEPAWRRALAGTPAIALPASVSPVPRELAFWLELLAVSFLVGFFPLAHAVRSERLFKLALGAVGICGAYAGLSILARETGWHYPFASPYATFGFLPNRNHTATFLIVGAILAGGVLAVACRDERWTPAVFAAACLLACAAGLLFFSESRAGIVFLFVGLVVWLAGLGRRHRHPRLLAGAGAVAALAAFGLLLFSTSAARDRLLASVGLAQVSQATRAEPADGPAALQDAPPELRLAIWRDTAAMIRDNPLTGVGLGGFPVTFAQYQRAALVSALPLHPESDWLMLTAETGVPAALCLAALLGLAFWRLRGARAHPTWPLRWACAAAAATAALHALVDVPAHRIVLGWWLTAVAGLGLQLPASQSPLGGRSRLQHLFFVAGGLGALWLGGQLVRAQWFGGPPLPPFVSAQRQREIMAVYAQSGYAPALEIARRATAEFPLNPTLQAQRGTLALSLPASDAVDDEIDAAFLAQRRLLPNWPDATFQQGKAWIGFDNMRSAPLWMDALARRERLNPVSNMSGTTVLQMFVDMLDLAARNPDLQSRLLPITERGPEFELAWLARVEPPLAAERIAARSGDAAFLARLDEKARGRFLRLWQDKGDRPALDRFLQAHGSENGWQTPAWAIRLRQLLAEHNDEAAVKEAAERYGISLTLPEVGSKKGLPNITPSLEVLDPAAAFHAYWEANDTTNAQRVLNEAVKGRPPVAEEIWRLQAALAVRRGDWPAAWQNLAQALRDSHPEEVP